jgi:hypothetical protein
VIEGQTINRHVFAIAHLVKRGGEISVLNFGFCMSNERIQKAVPTFGIQLTSSRSIPFVLASAGEIDFGTAYDLQQYGRTDILEQRIDLGCRFSWEAHGESELYEIISIT